MKKITALLLIISLLILTSCGKAEVNNEQEPTAQETTLIRIASLKGPTSMGLVNLYSHSDNDELDYDLKYQIAGSADEITPNLLSGSLDMAAIPANLAAVLFAKTEGKIGVIAINTYSVLYGLVPSTSDVTSFSDLKGKTIYSTGKGTTPEFALNYLLEKNGLDPETDVKIEFFTEATEVVSTFTQNADKDNCVAILPQPFATSAMMQNQDLKTVLSFDEEWTRVSDDSRMVTGVLVVNQEFAKNNPNLVKKFLADYESSVNATTENVDLTASLIESYGIVGKAAIAKLALPKCSITFVTGKDMKADLSGYLQTLYDQNPASTGGALPDDSFYLG